MAKQAGTKEITKNSLLEAGTRIMLEKGYTNTGIQEVLECTGIPKGSFYYYFDSKEDFGVQIIEYFDLKCAEHLRHFLDNKSLTPIERLRAFCEEGKRALENNQCRNGCLVGNLSQEMSDQSEVLRARLEEVLTKRRNNFAQVIKDAQECGEIKKEIDYIQLAEFFQSGWHGALMRAKTTKNIQPVQAYITIMFDHLLKP